jgi:phosphatidylethanolamine-binding protein (PEBP) family uncharacterized protein
MSARSLAPIALAAALVAATPARAAEFSISFRWCSGSPVTTLSGVPKGTATLVAELVDFQAPNYDHGGGKVAYTGRKSLACGAFPRYRGPSPPAPQVHTYQWTVKALAVDGSVLATAAATRRFPEK